MKYSQPYKIVLAIICCLAGARPGYAPNIYWQMWAIDASGNGADGLPDLVFAGRNGVGWFRHPGHQGLVSSPEDNLAEERIPSD